MERTSKQQLDSDTIIIENINKCTTEVIILSVDTLIFKLIKVRELTLHPHSEDEQIILYVLQRVL